MAKRKSKASGRKRPRGRSGLDALFPNGIDVYFDLIGGELLNQASERLALNARVVLCGLMAEYNSPERAGGPPPGFWIRARAVVTGLVVYDYEGRRQEFVEACLPDLEAGDVMVVSKGDEVDLREHAVGGKYTIYDFYADWCPPCRVLDVELRDLAATHDNGAIRKIDIIDWIEQIPFNETRNYVQRVMEGLYVYRARLSDFAGPMTIKQDLARGNR